MATGHSVLLAFLVTLGMVSSVFGVANIAAFNIQVFGQSKIGKPDVVDELEKIISRYDLVLIQEIRDSAGTAIVELLDKVNDHSSNTYAMDIGPRVGRTSSKEQYAYFYRTDMFWVKDSFTYSDPGDLFEREPYVVHFGIKTSAVTGVDDFSVIGLHSKPDDAVNELDEMMNVYEAAKSKFGNENSILMGDFNADCNYVRSSDWSSISIRTDSSFEWLISDYADTTVKSTDCAYDRIVLAGSAMKSAGYGGGVFDYQTAYGLSDDLAEDVSDHYPVYFKLK
ncbi:deoxyribonuclease-1-like [Diadema antillarum]|uniref:deoxyribonuclease-1-like n=1 Tax=Diadema antillarum TaxID=105358 RepID=UPI003A882EF9